MINSGENAFYLCVKGDKDTRNPAAENPACRKV